MKLNGTLVSIIFILSYLVCPPLLRGQTTFKVMWWNVENLFDTRHDTLKDDYEFLPEATRHWTYNKYKRKIDDIARVIAAIGQWTPPAIVGLCEVENDSVLKDLTRSSPLKELSYRYVMTHSADRRGIDIALLYQRDQFKLLTAHSINISNYSKRKHPTRDILHVNGLLPTLDTLDIFLCHFPSRSGGAKASEPYRLFIAQKLRNEAAQVINKRLHPKVIIMGDFNDYPTNRSVREILKVLPPSQQPNSSELYHLLARKVNHRNYGSYKYKGEWGLLDHLIVSGDLLKKDSPFYCKENEADVAFIPFLLEEDNKYGGKQPFRTYLGMKYQGGISDHLPVFVDFKVIEER